MTIKFTEKQLVILSAIAHMVYGDYAAEEEVNGKLEAAGLQDTILAQVIAVQESDPEGKLFRSATMAVVDDVLKGEIK